MRSPLISNKTQRNCTRNLRDQITFITLVKDTLSVSSSLCFIPFNFLQRCYGRSGRDLHSCLIEAIPGPWQHKRELAVRHNDADMLAKLDDIPDEGLNECVQRAGIVAGPSLKVRGGEDGGEAFEQPGLERGAERALRARADAKGEGAPFTGNLGVICARVRTCGQKIRGDSQFYTIFSYMRRRARFSSSSVNDQRPTTPRTQCARTARSACERTARLASTSPRVSAPNKLGPSRA